MQNPGWALIQLRKIEKLRPDLLKLHSMKPQFCAQHSKILQRTLFLYNLLI